MAWMQWLAPLALVTGLFPQTIAPPQRAPLGIETVDPLSVPVEDFAITVDRTRRYTVPIHIDAHGPFRFMIDTGAQATVISGRLADRLGLNERQQAMLVAMNSRRPIETVAIDGLRLGGRELAIRAAPIVESRHLGGYDGILGLDSLQDQRVLIDFENDTMSVGDAAEQGGNSGFEIVVRARRRLGQLIVMDARINGTRTAIIIDTGAQGSVGNLALLRRIGSNSLGTTAMEDINGVSTQADLRRIGSLTMGEMRLTNFVVGFADAQPFHALGLADRPALILGMNELRHFRRVAIDFSRQRVLFDMPRDSFMQDLMPTRL